MLNKVDLNKLQTFLLVAGRGGVTRAAAELGLTRSAVSQSLSGLEASLQVRLFHRVGRGLVLTREGRLLHQRLTAYQQLLEEALALVVNREREVRGAVRVGLFLGFSRLRLARVVARFTARHSAAEVRIRYAPHDELAADLAADRLDFVVSLSPLGERAAGIRSSRLLRQELVLAAGPGLHRPRLDLAGLSALPVVDYYRGDPLVHRWIRHHFGTRRPALRVVAWAATTDLVLELVLAGAGVGVLPRDLVEPYVKRRRLLLVETTRADLTDVVWLNELARPYPHPLLDAFRAVLREELPDA